MKNILSVIFAALTLGFATNAFAEATITGVTAQQRYPWDGKVDISYTASGIRAAMLERGLVPTVKILAIDEATHMTNVATAAAITGDASFDDGTHTIVWDMDAQGLKEINSESVVFKVTCDAVNGDDYETLQNKPSVNGTLLVGNKTSAELGLYAPSTAGTSGQILVSGGSGIPTWTTITKETVALDNVVNTGDSATPVSGGTTKFTTGGAYTELAKKVDLDSTQYSGLTRATLWAMKANLDGVTKVLGHVKFTDAEAPAGSQHNPYRVVIDRCDNGTYGTMTAHRHAVNEIYICKVTNSSGTPVYGNWVKLVTTEGATFTGNVIFKDSAGIRRSDDTGSMAMFGGSSTSASRITVFGCSHESQPGELNMKASKKNADGSITSKFLVARPDGSFYWDGKSVAVARDWNAAEWSVVSGKNIKYTKYNGIVYVSFYNYTTESSGEYSATTLPAGYRPGVSLPYVLRTLGTSYTVTVIVTTEGSLTFEASGIPTGTAFFGTLSYPSASN